MLEFLSILSDILFWQLQLWSRRQGNKVHGCNSRHSLSYRLEICLWLGQSMTVPEGLSVKCSLFLYEGIWTTTKTLWVVLWSTNMNYLRLLEKNRLTTQFVPCKTYRYILPGTDWLVSVGRRILGAWWEHWRDSVRKCWLNAAVEFTSTIQ